MTRFLCRELTYEVAGQRRTVDVSTQLVFLTFAVALVQLAALAVEYVTRQGVSAFAEIELLQGTAPTVLVVDEIQRVNCFVDSADLSDGLRQRGGSIIHLKGAHDAHGGDESEFE